MFAVSTLLLKGTMQVSTHSAPNYGEFRVRVARLGKSYIL